MSVRRLGIIIGMLMVCLFTVSLAQADHDTTAPAVGMDAENDDLVFSAPELPGDVQVATGINGTATDDASGVSLVRLHFTSELTGTVGSTAAVACSDESATSCTWRAYAPFGLPPGEYEMYAVAIDHEGNVGQSGSVTVTVI